MKVLFAGDFAPCRGYEAIVLERKEKVLGEALPLVESSDLSFVNLECPLTTSSQTINKSGPALKASPKCVDALKPFSVVGLANNHILDYGKRGLEDTLAACELAGLPTVGAGINELHGRQVFTKEINGLKVGVIAIAEHEFNQSEDGGPGSASLDPIDNYRQIQAAKELADYVIVTIHGGNEYFPYPRPGLRKLCHFFIELGVQAVICHHPHVPGAYEYHLGKPIVYSMGNFVFDTNQPPDDWEYGYMVQLCFSPESKQFESMKLVPYRQSLDLLGIQLLEGKEKSELLDRVEAYREVLQDDNKYSKEWCNYVEKHADSFIMKTFFPTAFRGIGFLTRNTSIAKVFYNKANSLAKLNVLRCQSHRELLISIMDRKSLARNE